MGTLLVATRLNALVKNANPSEVKIISNEPGIQNELTLSQFTSISNFLEIVKSTTHSYTIRYKDESIVIGAVKG